MEALWSMAQPPEGHLAGFCHKAHLPVRIEIGYGLGRVNINSRPADILIQGWDRGHPAAFDVTVTSPLTPATLNFSTVTEGAAAPAAEERKHASNDAKCGNLGWTCISLTVECNGTTIKNSLFNFPTNLIYPAPQTLHIIQHHKLGQRNPILEKD